MTHYAIDYFATLGKANGAFKCKSFPMTVNEDDPPYKASELWNEAITEIILIGSGKIRYLFSWFLVSYFYKKQRKNILLKRKMAGLLLAKV